MIMNIKNNQKGFVAILIITVIFFLVLGIVLVLSLLIVRQQKINQDKVASQKAYYAAEAGIEDALLKLKEDPHIPETNYSFEAGNAAVQISLSPEIGQSRVIVSTGNYEGRIRKIETVYELDASAVSFYYGAQAGEGGIEMGNNAVIKGNVFSNGSVVAPGGKGGVENSIIVANNGNKIEGLTVGGDALAYSCSDCSISGKLTYVSGGSAGSCSAAGGTFVQPEEIQPEPLPISQGEIDEWKAKAGEGGILTDDVVYDGVSGSLGPVQIGTSQDPKDLTVANGAVLTVKGNIYVTGNINFLNNSLIKLDQDSYGSLSGVILADGNITISNNSVLKGSGEAGSYILILSTSPSLDAGNPAVSVNNNAAGAIFYTTQGLIYVSNNVLAREITGYKILINNNAEIKYESGLENALFSNGPGGGWIVKKWKEAE